MSACATCGHDMADHQWADDDHGSYGDVCMVKGCPCPDISDAPLERVGGPDDGASEYPATTLAAELRDDGIRTVAASEAPFVAVAFDALATLCVYYDPEDPTLTSEDVWEMLGLRGYSKPAEPRAMGAVMRRGVKEGLIVPTDRFVTGRSPSRHAAPIRVFEVVR